MGLLNQDERQKLIDLLSLLPDIKYFQVRSSLVVTLPHDLQNSIVYIYALRPDIESIVDRINDDVWSRSRLSNDSYPVFEVIKIAKSWVRGSQVESELQDLMNMLRERLGLPPEKASDPGIPRSPDRFVQELYRFIQLLSPIKFVLDNIKESFGRYIIKPDCYAEQARLTRICTPVREFLTILVEEQSNDLEVQAQGLPLMSSLLSFNKQEEEMEKHIRHFCDEHGAKIREYQPADARENIQKQLDALVQRYELVLKSAERLYNQLYRL